MQKDLIAQLKQLKHSEVNPSEAWLQNNRALLLSQIKNTVSTEKQKINFDNIWNTMSLFVPRTLVFNVVRPIAVLLVVSVVATSGWITSVDAAYNALPGDWLYPAKRAAEKTQVAVATLVGAKNAETKLHSEFAKRRATETQQILGSNDPQKKEKAQEMVNDLKFEIASVNKKLDEIKTANTNVVSADTVKDVKQDTEQVKNTLQEVKNTLLIATTADASTTAAVTQAVSEAKDLAKDTSVKAVEVIVAKHLEGDQSVSADEIKKEITATLLSATTDASASKQNMVGVQAVVTAAKTEAKDLVKNTTTTVALNQKISQAATAANDASAQTKTATDSVDKSVVEATDLMNKGDLTKAIEKVKEANTATKQAEKISDQAVSSVAQIAPVAPVLPLITSPDIKKEDIKVVIDTTTSAAPAIKIIVPTTTNTKIIQP